jgi:hypothetical protein
MAGFYSHLCHNGSKILTKIPKTAGGMAFDQAELQSRLNISLKK